MRRESPKCVCAVDHTRETTVCCFPTVIEPLAGFCDAERKSGESEGENETEKRRKRIKRKKKGGLWAERQCTPLTEEIRCCYLATVAYNDRRRCCPYIRWACSFSVASDVLVQLSDARWIPLQQR